MFLRENPVLQRELLSNLRSRRAFVLQFCYVALLGGVVYSAWPEAKKIDMTNPEAARRLVNLFFLGQYLVASLMTPSFAAGAITGEKERRSYEMLLASPLRPGAIVLGKLLASLCPLAILIFSSLPIVMLCLPLGGVSPYEVLVAYLALILSVASFGMISLACSSYFVHTTASLVVSYLLILPLALVGLLFWQAFGEGRVTERLVATVAIMPVVCSAICTVLFMATTRRLLHPPDVGSEGKQVIDEEQELRQAVGMVIQRHEFPDRLFAPPKRDDLLPDGANPVYDKEMRSELFSQGTLMLRLVIQISMVLALPLMAFCLYFFPQGAPWYIAYVILFNMLVGPVFSAGSVTSERQRQTLDLLLVTTLSPWQILWGKLLAGLRISSVLTLFLLWPVLLSLAMVPEYWANLPTFANYLLLVLLTCLTTAVVALFCSVVFQKTSTAMTTAYLLMVALFLAPLAVSYFAGTFFSGHASTPWLEQATCTSPFAAVFSLPLEFSAEEVRSRPADWSVWFGFLVCGVAGNAALLGGMLWLFRMRWRVSS